MPMSSPLERNLQKSSRELMVYIAIFTRISNLERKARRAELKFAILFLAVFALTVVLLSRKS